MKLRKQIKNRIVAVTMLAVVFISNITVAFASESGLPSYDVKYTDNGNSDKFELYRMNFSAIHRVAFINKESDFIGFAYISKSPSDASCVYLKYDPNYGTGYQASSGNYKLESEDANKSVASFEFTYNDTTYYVAHMSFLGALSNGTFSGSFGRFYSVNDSQIVYNFRNYITQYITGQIDESKCTLISDGDSESSSDESTWKGSANNPIKKDDFGYPQIYNSTYIHNDPNNLETLDKLYSGQDFQWKKKTTTGFDLTNNDYNYTYIECKVKANYQYNDKFSGKGSWHDFASYGEMGNLGKVRAESLSHYYTFQEFQEALPKTSNELPDHKMRAIKSSAVFYFRVVCMKTSSTVVIPDEKDCKYYAGPWRSVTVTKINGKDGTSVVEDGEFDENGEWKKDDDSDDNGKDIDNGSAEGDDLSDASDKAHETINSNANKSTLDLDSAKAFIKQVADVPKMIGDIFSFFPSWVKYTVELGFAFIFILIVYKLIRG